MTKWAAQRRYQERNKHPCSECLTLVNKTSLRCKACDRRWRQVEMSKNPVRLRHGYARAGLKDPTYNVWASMIQRCTDARVKNYDRYGGRGIKVCVRWRRFENFLADMGPRPAGRHSSGRALFTIDRKDNDGNYTPKNCKWATYKEQLTHTSHSRYVTYRGKTLTLAQWVERLGISYASAHRRLARGWSVSKTFREGMKT